MLQDNIILCDTKSGVLLAFTGAMVIFCLESVAASPSVHHLAPWATLASVVGFFIAAIGFLISGTFSLSTVMPRIHRRAPADHIFWEAPSFRLSVEDYIGHMHALDVHVEHDEKLRHLHTLAMICRAKFAHLRHAMNFAILGFVLIVVAELAKAAP